VRKRALGVGYAANAAALKVRAGVVKPSPTPCRETAYEAEGFCVAKPRRNRLDVLWTVEAEDAEGDTAGEPVLGSAACRH
jgi:hypothetical protein